MEKDKVFIDCQFFQTPAWNRGMGKYTLSLLESAARDLERAAKVILVFTKNLPRDKDMVTAVSGLFIDASILELDLKTTDKYSYGEAAGLNKTVLDKHIGSREQGKTTF